MTKGDKSKYVLQALEFIAGHYADQDISITTIAAHLGVSEGHLSHVFKKETSYTIISYLTQYRVHAAMKLLQDCRYKVYEVAVNCRNMPLLRTGTVSPTRRRIRILSFIIFRSWQGQP